jgi:enoyl-CoA hydratase/carnithine racemase
LRRYVSHFGLQASKRAFLLGQSMPYETLDSLGIFEALVEVNEFEAAIHSMVDSLNSMAPLALASTKKSLNDIAAGLYNEPALKERSRHSVFSHDFAEGRTAFAERRKPLFTGS